MSAFSTELRVRGASGESLHVRIMGPSGPGHEGTVLFCHGLGEHSGRHLHVAQAYVEAGWRAVLFDLPGHGHSSGTRGHINEFDDFIRDLERVRETQIDPAEPLILHGHSMGGLVVMRGVLNGLRPPLGVIVSAPWLGLSMRVAGWKMRLARWAARYWPSLLFSTGIRRESLSSDPGFVASLPDAHLAHRKISAALYFGAKEAGDRVRGSAFAWRCPLLMLLGEEDPVIDLEASKEFFHRAAYAHKTLKIYPGMRHEPQNESGRMEVIRDVVDWVRARGN